MYILKFKEATQLIHMWQHKWHCSGAFIVNFELMSHPFRAFLLFTLGQVNVIWVNGNVHLSTKGNRKSVKLSWVFFKSPTSLRIISLD